MEKTITLPIKCSTLQKIDDINSYCQAALMGAYGGLFVAFITIAAIFAPHKELPPSLGFYILTLITLAFSFAGFLGCLFFAYIFLRERIGDIKFECIKDEEP